MSTLIHHHFSYLLAPPDSLKKKRIQKKSISQVHQIQKFKNVHTIKGPKEGISTEKKIQKRGNLKRNDIDRQISPSFLSEDHIQMNTSHLGQEQTNNFYLPSIAPQFNINYISWEQTEQYQYPHPTSAETLCKLEKQFQTLVQSIMRPLNNSILLLPGDICLQSDMKGVPLSEFKRICQIKRELRGRIEVLLDTDQVEKGLDSIVESQGESVAAYLKRVEHMQLNFAHMKAESPLLLDNLINQADLKKEQFLSKFDFTQKYIFALEHRIDQTKGTTQFKRVFYSQNFLTLFGLMEHSQLTETFLLRNGVIDLHSRIQKFSYASSNDDYDDEPYLLCSEGIQSQYLKPIERVSDIQTLDGFMVKVSVKHDLFNLNQEFKIMFSDDQGFLDIPNEHLSVYELEVSNEDIQNVMAQRKYHFLNNILSGRLPTMPLIEKYYS